MNGELSEDRGWVDHLGRLSDNIEQPARSFYANSKVE